MFPEKDPLPWRLKPIPELVRLAWPTAVSMLSFSVMTLVDTLFVGRLGASQLAAVSLGGVLAFVVICFGFGLLRATKLLVAQAVGAGRARDVPALTGAAVWLALGLGVLAILGGQLLSGAAAALGPDAATGEWAARYFSIRNLGAPLFYVAVALRESSYGQGNARLPMRATLLANATNIALDALLIFCLGWGVDGAAWATVGAYGVEVAVLLCVSAKRAVVWAPPRLSRVSELVRVGVPLGLQFVLEFGAFAVLVALLARAGKEQLAAHQIAMQLVHFSFLPALAMGEAASVLAGQAVGANRDDLVRRVARAALGLAALYTGLCALLFVAGQSVIPALFTSDPAVRAVSARLLLIAAAFQLADAANAVARSVLRAAGDVRYPAALAVTIAWVLTPTTTWWLGLRLGYGAVGAWLGLLAEIVVGALLLWRRLERERWKTHAQQSRLRLARPSDSDLEPDAALAPAPLSR